MQSYEKVSGKSPKVLLKLNIQMRSIDGNFAGNKLTVLISIAQKDGIEATKIAEAFDLSRGTTSNVILFIITSAVPSEAQW